MDKIDRKFHPIRLYIFIVHLSKPQTEKPGLMLILSIFWSAKAGSDRPGHDFRKEQTTSQRPCGNSKELIYKILLSYMWYNYHTIFHKRKLESVLKQERDKSFQTKVVTVTSYAHCTYNILLEYELPIL